MPKKLAERTSLTTTAPWTNAGMDLDLAQEVKLFNKIIKDDGKKAFRPVDCVRGIFNQGTEEVVATVGSRYALVQHEEVLLSGLQALEELGVQPTSIKTVQTDKRMTAYVQLSMERNAGRYGPNSSVEMKEGEGIGDVIHFGLRFVNTLDGTTPVMGGLWAQRLACANTMLGALRTVMSITKKHTKKDTEDLDLHLKTFVGEAVGQIEEWVGSIRDAAQIIVTNDEAELLVSAAFNKRLAVKVIEAFPAYVEEMGSSRWALYNAATHVLTHDVDASQATLERHHASANKLFTMEVPVVLEVAAE